MFKTTSRYYYSKLDKNSKEMYLEIYKAWENLEKVIKLNNRWKIEPKQIEKIITYIYYDNPSFFYIDLTEWHYEIRNYETIIYIKYSYSDIEIKEIYDKIKNIIKNIDGECTSNCKTEFEKVEYIHNYLTKNIDYNKNVNEKNSHNIVGALLYSLSVCEGYAKTFKLFCDILGLKCIVVNGTSTNDKKKVENHIWNIVSIESKYVQIDITWDSTLRKYDDKYDYFNISDTDMLKDHTWDKNFYPKCVTNEFSYFYITKSIVKNESEFVEFIKSKMKEKNYKFTIKIEDKSIKSQEQVLKIIEKTIKKYNILKSYYIQIYYNDRQNIADIIIE